MEIEFELEEIDYINFNIDHARQSSSLKKSLIIQRLLGPFIFSIAAVIVTRFSPIPLWYWMTLFSIASIIWLIFYPNFFNWELRRKIVKLLQEGNNEILFRKRKIIVTDKGIIEKNIASETCTTWNEINSVDETNDYIYIYNSSISAYIIPKKIFKNKNTLKLFLEEISKYYIVS